MPLVVTLMIGTLLGALASALTAAATTEALIAGAHRNSTALLYGAEAGAEYGIAAIAQSDWAETIDGAIETPYASRALEDFTGLPRAGLPATVAIWVTDLTAVYGVMAADTRVARITATATGPNGARRTVRAVVRLTELEEEVRIERLSWTS
jgi:hypothetical protein